MFCLARGTTDWALRSRHVLLGNPACHSSLRTMEYPSDNTTQDARSLYFENSTWDPEAHDRHVNYLYCVGGSVRQALSAPALFVTMTTIIVFCKYCGKLSNHHKLALNQCVLDMVFALYVILEAQFPNYWCSYFTWQLTFNSLIILVCCNLIYIALDVFVAVQSPLKYPNVVTHRRVNLLILVTYLLAGLVNVSIVATELVLWKVRYEVPDESGIAKVHEDDPVCQALCRYYSLVFRRFFETSTYVFVSCCLLTLIVVYSYVFSVVRRKQRGGITIANANLRKSAVTSLCVIASFIICFGLYFITDFVGRYLAFSPGDVGWISMFYIRNLIPLNSLFDALIYSVRLTTVRNGYRKMWLQLLDKCRCRRQDSGRWSSHSTTTGRPVTVILSHDTGL